jgi:hypothetical protein
LDIFYEYRKISFGIRKYRWSPIKPVFGEISEISAEKKNPVADSGVIVLGKESHKNGGLVL